MEHTATIINVCIYEFMNMHTYVCAYVRRVELQLTVNNRFQTVTDTNGNNG